MKILKNSDKQILKAFAVGENIRLFQTNDSILKCYNFNKELQSTTKLTTVDLSGHYFLKDVNSMNISTADMFPPGFIDTAKKETRNQRSDVYYNVDSIDVSMSQGFMQYNGRCYFMNKNSYLSNADNYSIYTYKNERDAYNLLANYISENYNSGYFKNAQLVDNKAVPIYDINGKASLENISFIKFANPSKILPLLAEHGISEMSSSILFNSNTLSLNEDDFDSIYVKNLIDGLSEYDPDECMEKAETLFDDMFANLDKESFLRMFNPVGQMRSIKNEKYSLKENEYLYSIDLTTTSKNIYDLPVNYFSLKNLKSPELYQNYYLIGINENSSVKSNAYDLMYNIVAKFLIDFKETVSNSMHDFISKGDVISNLNTIVTPEFITGLAYTLINNGFPKYTVETLEEEFTNAYPDYLDNKLFYTAYFKYNKLKYGINIRQNTNIVKKDQLLDELHTRYDEFKDEKYNILALLPEIEKRKLITTFDRFISLIDNILAEETTVCSNQILTKFENCLYDLEVNGFSLIEKLQEQKLFDRDIYKAVIEPVLKTMGEIDARNFENPNQIDLLNFRERMNSKIDSYLSIYDNMFVHENEFKISGILYGSRDYNDCFKNSSNEMYLTYNYDTSVDLNFLEENIPDSNIKRFTSYEDLADSLNTEGREIQSILSSNNLYIFDSETLALVLSALFGSEICMSSEIEQNRLNAELIEGVFLLQRVVFISDLIELDSDKWLNTNLGKMEVVKISENEYSVVLKDSKIGKYIEVLQDMKEVDFAERIKGEHYYKELEKSKSNVFSLRVKNSGLTYELYSFDEVLGDFIDSYNLQKLDNGQLQSLDTGKIYDFSEILNVSKYRKIIEDENTYFNEIKDNSATDDYSVFKYFKLESDDEDTDYIRKLIKAKIHIRNTFNNSIRKSIHRYMPVNTTLWKIDYI